MLSVALPPFWGWGACTFEERWTGLPRLRLAMTETQSQRFVTPDLFRGV